MQTGLTIATRHKDPLTYFTDGQLCGVCLGCSCVSTAPVLRIEAIRAVKSLLIRTDAPSKLLASTEEAGLLDYNKALEFPDRRLGLRLLSSV